MSGFEMKYLPKAIIMSLSLYSSSTALLADSAVQPPARRMGEVFLQMSMRKSTFAVALMVGDQCLLRK